MYNLKLKNVHPSTICVLLSKFEDSFNALLDVITSPLPEDSLEEFIEGYARTDEIMPEDKTIGFIIINKEKKVVSLTFTQNTGIVRQNVEKILEKYKKLGYKTEVEYAKTPY
ncbi:TA0956 family protein [Acidiplasma sp.]|jgi:hypothetical protein|nr:TA0956 family protein [Acidiplasma sp.]WMT55658.1 MAG: TA0956 family protein [Acidiplasma sp.]